MKLEEFFERLALVPVGLMVVFIIVVVIKRASLGPVQKLLVALVVAALIADLLSLIRWRSDTNTFPLFHIYALVEYSVLALFFAMASRHKIMARVYYASIPVAILLGVINALFFQSIYQPNTNIIVGSSAILVISSLILLFRILNDMRYEHLYKSSVFWINIGVLIYFSSSLVLFSFGGWLSAITVEYTINVWVVHVLVNIVHYICFNVALWMKPE